MREIKSHNDDSILIQNHEPGHYFVKWYEAPDSNGTPQGRKLELGGDAVMTVGRLAEVLKAISADAAFPEPDKL